MHRGSHARARQTDVDKDSIFQEGDAIGKTYRVIKRIGRGGYGEIFACVTPNGERVAVKVEKATRCGNLQEEANILQLLKNCKYVPRVRTSLLQQDAIYFLVMDLYGENLSNLRRKQSGSVFSVTSTCMLARQMLRCIREVHNAGVIHRDIKPGNFVLGTRNTTNPRTVIMIDYGLSKEHFDADGKPKEKKATARWVGSRRYMSLHTHLRKDQGRRDDLWSLVYVIIEFCTGTLPWAHLRGVENLDKIRDAKIHYLHERHVINPDFVQIIDYLKLLHYETEPDYKFIDGILAKIFYGNGGNRDTKFDWETREEARQFIEMEEKVGWNDIFRNEIESEVIDVVKPSVVGPPSPIPQVDHSDSESKSNEELCTLF